MQARYVEVQTQQTQQIGGSFRAAANAAMKDDHLTVLGQFNDRRFVVLTVIKSAYAVLQGQ
ncbi:hypothetical protein TOC8172_09900 [Pseudomonas syringae]